MPYLTMNGYTWLYKLLFNFLYNDLCNNLPISSFWTKCHLQNTNLKNLKCAHYRLKHGSYPLNGVSTSIISTKTHCNCICFKMIVWFLIINVISKTAQSAICLWLTWCVWAPVFVFSKCHTALKIFTLFKQVLKSRYS